MQVINLRTAGRVTMLEDRVYSERQIAQILEFGVSPQAIEEWPRIAIPEALEAVARANLMNDPNDPHLREALEEAIRPRRGFRTEWGCIVIDHGLDEDGLDERLLLNIAGYLANDPYLQLPHLCSESAAVGAYLSDVANPVLAVSAEKYLCSRLDWGENDSTNQLFEAFAFVQPTSTVEFREVGVLFGQWLEAAGVAGILTRCSEPDYLAKVAGEGDVFVSSRPRADSN
ncbi:hypothetical protein SB751_19875 [Cupriavidus sp. SIMBA_020]|jgi:hypothetical protein|uniref:hypothetical protein n=1 Tax=Cupriavidus sp. SIMBA_020 TaxID=3085766 RepID=UPI00397AEA43